MAIAQRVWAFIENNTVKNIIVCENYQLADSLAKNTINFNAYAVEITQIPTAIGHKYEDGFFKDLEGNIIETLPTTEQEVAILKDENALLKEQNESLSMTLDSVLTDVIPGLLG